MVGCYGGGDMETAIFDAFELLFKVVGLYLLYEFNKGLPSRLTKFQSLLWAFGLPAFFALAAHGSGPHFKDGQPYGYEVFLFTVMFIPCIYGIIEGFKLNPSRSFE